MPPDPSPKPTQTSGLEHAGVIDALMHDTKTDEAWLVMLERRPWDGGEAQLFQLQEKLNAYLSYALDGEMVENYPVLVEKAVRVILDTTHPPNTVVVDFLGRIREQLGFQGVALEVRITGEAYGEDSSPPSSPVE